MPIPTICSLTYFFALWWLTPLAEPISSSKMAIFDLTEPQEGNFHLKAVFNRRNLLQTLQGQYGEVIEDSLSAPLTEYLAEHVTFSFDDEPVTLEWQEARTGEQFVSIEAKIRTAVQKPYRIRITNTCLIQDITQHANLIRLYLHQNKRIFRLDASRKSTVVQYRP